MVHLSRPILLVFIWGVFCMPLISRAQELPPDQQEKIKELSSNLNQAIDQNNHSAAAGYSGKMGYLYWNHGMYPQAVQSFEQAIAHNKNAGNLNGIKTLRYNLGLIYTDQEKYNLAIPEFDQGIEIARELQQKEGILSGLTNKASALKSMGSYEKSIEVTNEALDLAKELNNLKLIRRCYGLLAENHQELGNSKQSMEYFDRFSTIDKHIKKEQISKLESKTQEKVKEIESQKAKKEKQLADKEQELEVAQDSLKESKELTEKQQMELKLKELTLTKQETQLRNERLIRYGLTGVVLLIMAFLVVIFFQFRQKKKANRLLSSQNKQINEQKDKIEEQRDLANRQKKDIMDSIEYASRIQNALLPPNYLLNKWLTDYFILFQPRDVVSGDFYWMTHKDNKLILAAADCTGHGVPGAFMSMLGIAFLNEIVNRITENEHIYSLQANEILNQLRDYIIESLHQNKDDSDSKDGIDMALTIIDFESKKIQYAGAHNPLILIRNDEIIEKKADRMPVAIHKKADQPFSNHELDFKEEDTMYLFSDGFPDQIGGPKGRKYMSGKFKKLLLKIHQKPMEEQKQILLKELEEWKNGYQQLDDILIIGSKLKSIKKPAADKRKEEYNWQDYRILIAEDTEMNFLFLKEALKGTGVEILHAKDGQEAIGMIEQNQDIDLILMDINMPKMDGFESTSKIKKITQNIPIIAQTALNIEDAKEKAEKAGCDDFITKPIKLKTFLNLIDQYLT